MTEIYAPGGINCAVWDCYIATKKDDKEARQRMAEKFEQASGKKIDPETYRSPRLFKLTQTRLRLYWLVT